MAVTLASDLSLFNAILVIGVAIPTMYMGASIKIRPLKIMYFLLPTFLLLLGLYHLVSFLGDLFYNPVYGFMGDSILEPLSYIVFFAFAVYLARRGG